MKTARDLVLGCGTDYSRDQMLPFVASLRATGFAGDIGLVVYAGQCAALAEMVERYSVTLIPIQRTPAWLPSSLGGRLQNRGRMLFVHQAISRMLPVICANRGAMGLLAPRLHYFFHIACGRYLLYFAFLLQRRATYARVLLSDVRDVVFQADPFFYAKDSVLTCFWDARMCLGDEPINTGWMAETFGEAYCTSRKGARISCSGTTLGDCESMLAYLSEMSRELLRRLPRAVGLHGVDQAVHNFLIWESRLANLRMCENRENAVMTLKNEPFSKDWFDARGVLLNADGRPAPVLHQYEFHPELDAKWGAFGRGVAPAGP